MNKIKSFVIILTFLSSVTILAQDINFKKGVITIDGKECLKYDSDPNNVSYQNINGDDIIILKFIRVNGQLYNKVVFTESHQEFTTQSYIFTKKLLIEKLLKSNVLVDCTLNEEKVRTFVLKFDEKVEERLKPVNTNTNTVIIKEEPRSGVNINIGR